MDDARYGEMVDRVRKIRHDANSPITAALGHVQLLLDGLFVGAVFVLRHVGHEAACLPRVVRPLRALRVLRARGIPVVAYDAEAEPAMPFPDRRFDVVLNRHEAYVASEVRRVLRPGGCFLTQQVDGRDFEETQAIFGGTSDYPHITLANLRAEAEAAGLEVTASEEWQGETRFADVAALVRYFAFVPWEVPEDFDVDKYADQLLDLHHSGRDLVFTQRRFYLRARRTE